MQKKSAIFPPLGLATMLAIGLFMVIYFVTAWVVMLTDAMEISNRQYRQESVMLLADGSPVICCQNHGMLGHATTYHSLDGKEIALTKTDSLKSLSYLQQKNQKITANSFYMTPQNRIIRIDRGEYIRRAPGQDLAEVWYFVRDGKLAGKAYFVGYDLKSRQCLGYIGRRGKTAELLREEDRFPFDGRNC